MLSQVRPVSGALRGHVRGPCRRTYRVAVASRDRAAPWRCPLRGPVMHGCCLSSRNLHLPYTMSSSAAPRGAEATCPCSSYPRVRHAIFSRHPHCAGTRSCQGICENRGGSCPLSTGGRALERRIAVLSTTKGIRHRTETGSERTKLVDPTPEKPTSRSATPPSNLPAQRSFPIFPVH
jgi:hypothetical protein